MSKAASSESNQTEKTTTLIHGRKTIKNTFAPNCGNEYFTDATLFSLCKYGFPFDDLPEEAKEIVTEYEKEYSKKRTNLAKVQKAIQEMRDDPTVIM